MAAKQFDFDENHSSFTGRRYDEVVVLRFKKNLLFRLTDLEAKSRIFNYLDQVAAGEAIKVLLIASALDKQGRDEYVDFYENIFHSEFERGGLLRMCNAINQFILKIRSLNKVVIHVDSGEVIMMFLNLSLACDYRIVADNTVFQNPCLDLGLVPKGGGPYFLSRMLGAGKAFEILSSCQDIRAREALELGLVDQVVPVDQLEEAALATAHRFCRNSSHSMAGIKRLLNFSLKDLPEYLEYENQELLRIIDRGQVRRTC